MIRHPFFAIIIAALVGVAGFHLVGIYLSLYWLASWYDIIPHFLGGFWIGALALWLVYLSRSGVMLPVLAGNTAAAFVVAALAAIVVGVLWELWEVWVDAELLEHVGYATDTAIDLIADTAGALTVAGLFVNRRYHEVVPESGIYESGE